MRNLHYIAKCVPGIEDQAARELTAMGGRVLGKARGYVILDAGAGFEGMVETKGRTLEALARGSSGGSRAGTHELEALLGSAASLHGRAAWPPEGFVNVMAKPGHLRGYRRFNHPSALLPTVAAALLMLTDPDTDLIDPFVGGGTIVIEDALSMKQRGGPPGHRIAGVDINPRHLSGARKNVTEAGLSGEVDLVLGDATRFRPETKYSRMVTNPPFGVSGSKLNRVLLLYQRFADNIEHMVLPGSKCVIITSDAAALRKILLGRGYGPVGSTQIRHGHLWTAALQFVA